MYWKVILLLLLPVVLYHRLGPIATYYHKPLFTPPLCHWVYCPGGQSAQWVESGTMTAFLASVFGCHRHMHTVGVALIWSPVGSIIYQLEELMNKGS